MGVPKAVAFDLDGLMVNTEDLYDDVGAEILGRRGKTFSRELKDAMMGRPAAAALQIMIKWHGLSETVEQLRAESEECFKQLLAERLRPMPGLLDLLNALHRSDIPRAIATSSRRSFAEQVTSQLKIQHFFEFLVCSEDVSNGKPDPEVYLTAASNFGLPTKSLLVLEDSANGCRAAVAAGALAIAVPSHHSRHHDFMGVTLVADSLADRRIYDLLGL